MERLKNEFLEELSQFLKHHQEKDSILQEYDAHLEALLAELQF